MFQDRKDAGCQLAHEVAGHHLTNPVVLALPRGGVPVAFEVARVLKAPLDLLLVRKIGDAAQPELAVAAVAEAVEAAEVAHATGRAPSTAMHWVEVLDTGRDADALEPEVEQQLDEIERRRALYLRGRPRVPVLGRTVVVVDDGIATGTTMRAALQSLRQRQPARIVVAVPVAPPAEVTRLLREVDEVIVLETPRPFGAVGNFYRDFTQTTDAEVVAVLDASR